MAAITLEDVALADITAAEALTAFGAALTTLTTHTANDVYVALRSWLWKTINGRRRDQELREWYALMQKVGARIEERDSEVANKIEALQDLLYETIGVSEVLPTSDVLRRKHVRELLLVLARNGGRLAREEIARQLSLQQSNLTRVLNLALDTGLVDRRNHGKHAIFELTRDGAGAVKQVGIVEGTSLKLPALKSAADKGRRFWGGSPPESEFSDGLEVVEYRGEMVGYSDTFEKITADDLVFGGRIAAVAKRSITTMPKLAQPVERILAFLASRGEERDKPGRRSKHSARSHDR